MSLMQADAAAILGSRIPRPRGSHRWDHESQPPPEEITAPYGDGMSPVPDVNRARFAAFVSRVLTDARARGLTDQDIAKSTRVGTSTFHRWKNGEFRTLPDIENVQRFCDGLGVSAQEALDAMGVTSSRSTQAPEPVLEPEVRIIQRALVDPSVTAERKAAVREMLRLIATGLKGGRG